MPSLSGIKVLDFSHALAGPFCTLLLVDHGAAVYKIEAPDGGDPGRGWGPPFVGDQTSYFLGLNRGKRSLAIDLKCPQGVELCSRMIEKADIVIENFRPGTMPRLGLGYEAARLRNPRIIYCSISGYGQTGPSQDEPAMDLILQASSGLMSVTGTTNGERVRCGYSVADVTNRDVCPNRNFDGTETPGRFWFGAVRGRFDARFHDLRNDHQFYDLSSDLGLYRAHSALPISRLFPIAHSLPRILTS